jgi:hypothetical protein
MKPGELNPNSRAVLAILAAHENAAGFSFINAALLSKLADIPLVAVRRAARVLCRRNLAEYGYGGYAAMAAGRKWVRANGEEKA